MALQIVGSHPHFIGVAESIISLRHAGNDAGFVVEDRLAYNAASDHFDDEPLVYWARTGSGTVDRLALSPESRR